MPGLKPKIVFKNVHRCFAGSWRISARCQHPPVSRLTHPSAHVVHEPTAEWHRLYTAEFWREAATCKSMLIQSFGGIVVFDSIPLVCGKCWKISLVLAGAFGQFWLARSDEIALLRIMVWASQRRNTFTWRPVPRPRGHHHIGVSIPSKPTTIGFCSFWFQNPEKPM